MRASASTAREGSPLAHRPMPAAWGHGPMLAHTRGAVIRRSAAPGADLGECDELPPRTFLRRCVAGRSSRAAGAANRSTADVAPHGPRAQWTRVHALVPGGHAVPRDHVPTRLALRVRTRHRSEVP